MMTKAQLVFQAYGNERILEECLFALLSLSACHTEADIAAMTIHIYTDQPEWFEAQQIPLPLQYHRLKLETINRWRGTINFVHRMKIEVLRDLTAQVQTPVLYLDTDVCFLKPVTPLFDRMAGGELFMHVMEGIVADKPNPVLRKLHTFLAANNPLKINGVQLHADRLTAMWNAGVLGFDSRYYPLLEQVLAFTDNIYPQFPKHVIEQFAFSLYFQRQGQVHQTADRILHYWNFKEFRQYLASFFSHYKDASWSEKLHYAQMLQVPVLIQEKLNFYSNRSIAGKLQGKHWQPRIPDWDLQAKQL
jgi:hypothetical protein